MAQCPKCFSAIDKVKIEGVTGRVIGGSAYNAITYSCPFCFVILSVGIDPVALKTDTVNEVVKKLQGY
jgi:hypothetical protein